MRALLFLIVLINTHWVYSQSIFDEFIKYQNEDGSFGGKNKEIITSLVLLAYMGEGYSPSSKKYGKEVKEGLKYLSSKVKEVAKTPSEKKFVYTTWAMSYAYNILGISILDENCKDLYSAFLKDVKKGNGWDFSKITSRGMIIPSICALQSLDASGVIEDELKVMMKAYAIQIQRDNRFNVEVNFYINAIKIIWGIEELPASVPEGIEVKMLAQLLSGLNSDSASERRRTFNKCLYLNTGEITFLINELRDSAIVELNQVAKDLEEKINIADSDYNEIFEFEEVTALLIYLGSCYSYVDGYNGFKVFKAKVNQRFLTESGELTVNGAGYLKSISETLTKTESKLANAAIGALIYSEYDLLSLHKKFESVHRAKVREFPLREEGLDLVD